MANSRQKRLMQEALDEALSSEALQELYTEIDRNPDNSAEFNRLKQVDKVLRTAPFERAPERLAVSIMARLAEGLQRAHPKASGLSLALGLALVTLALLPLLGALGWTILSTLGSAEALGGLLRQVVGLLGTLVSALDSLVEGAQDVLATYPEAPLLVVTLIPLALFWLGRLAAQQRDSADE